jgi:AbrB family looped-hinge helix DNA binding protein
LKALKAFHTVDSLGRLCIPADMRRLLGIVDGSFVEMTAQEDGTILLEPVYERCALCLRPINGKPAFKQGERRSLCAECVKAVRKAK